MDNGIMMGLTVGALRRLIEHEERQLVLLDELDNQMFESGRAARAASRKRKQLTIAKAQEVLAAKGVG
jgi:hypothetical protein